MRESWELPLPGYEKEIDKTIEAKLRKTSPRGQSVFAGVFDDSKNPENPSKTIALVCEPYGVFSKTKLSYVGRMLGASVCRTLRDNGIAVKGIGFFDLENEIPSVRDVQGLWIHLGSSNMSGEQVAAIKKYVSGGNDAGHIHKTRDGVRCLAISAPTRYLHSGSCVTATANYDHIRDLVLAMLNRWDELN